MEYKVIEALKVIQDFCKKQEDCGKCDLDFKDETGQPCFLHSTFHCYLDLSDLEKESVEN